MPAQTLSYESPTQKANAMSLATVKKQPHKPDAIPRSDSAISYESPPASALIETRQVAAWAIIFWLSLIHLGALAAPFTFTWQGLAVAVALHWFTGGIGICLGYHRLLTHGSFLTYRPVRWLLAAVGGLAGEGSAIEWVANHRKHHAHSDQPGDPHSPREGAWWSHMLWLVWTLPPREQEAHVKKWAPDLQRDPMIRFISNMFLPMQIAMGVLVMLAGYALGGMAMAASFVVWGVFLRLVFVLHSTWFVNSASHMWGYRNYETTDDSRNLWWVAIIAYGEGWHNNHHAYPRMAPHGHKWWEFDMTYAAIRVMRACGLAWDVVNYKHKSEVEPQNAA